MQKFGVCLLGFAPMRGEPADSAEMISQVLFGETYRVLKEKEDGKWLYIQNAFDKYEGWMHINRHHEVSQAYFEEYISDWAAHKICLDESGMCLFGHRPLRYFKGSVLPFYEGNAFRIEQKWLHSENRFFNPSDASQADQAVDYARTYLGTPYLWGGRGFHGTDCSGFVQQVFRVFGITLPRDSSVQANEGVLVQPGNQQKGDLAFFKNEKGRIVHVGMLSGAESIIHSSAWVKEERLDTEGIVNTESGEYSHKLAFIKRIFL